MSDFTFYWHDYETFGADPRRDRPCQFAGIRTDKDLNIVGEPLVIYCQAASDMLPQPEACLVTGITPQIALAKGVRECEFIGAIHKQLAMPGTCGIGYNSIRFDDEVTRHCLYRNFYDPYGREWQNGNSRWDIIDMARLTRALRPAGINWPVRDDGNPSFRLDQLTLANGIEHENAHDALADVYASIELAKLIRTQQPKLYRFAFDNRGKQRAAQLLSLGSMRPLLHVSEKYPSEKGCLAVVLPIVRHPRNPNGVIVYNLAEDPEPLLELSSADIRHRVFTRFDELPPGTQRIPLKTVHLNRSPVLAPLPVLRPQDAERLGVCLQRCEEHRRIIESASGIGRKIEAVFDESPPDSDHDPDLMLYSGGFFNDSDRALMERLRALPPEKLDGERLECQDPRIPEMLLRYKGRNYPQYLTESEAARWEAYRRNRLMTGKGASITIGEFRDEITALKSDSANRQLQSAIIDDLADYANNLLGAD